jgi:hypothetical protein
MIVLPSLVSEYSKALALDLVARRVINPVDSRLRRVLVSMRRETFPTFAAQLPVPVGPFFQREEDLRRPSADKDRVAACFHARYSLVLGAHEINLTLNVEMLGVTSVAGFKSHLGAGSTWTR